MYLTSIVAQFNYYFYSYHESGFLSHIYIKVNPHVECWECGMFRMWDVRDVRCWGCGMFGMWNVGDVGCLGCGMFAGMWDVDFKNA